MEQFFADYIDRIQDLHSYYHKAFDGLTTEQLDWVPGEEMNSLCVLAMHVSQAERYWVGVSIGDPIKRNRPAEFEASGHTADDLKQRFEDNLAYYKTALETVSVANFGQTITIDLNPNNVWQTTMGWGLLHALDHTAEHLGHVGITRQLVDRR